MLDIVAASDRVLGALPTLPAERVPLGSAAGRVLARDVVSTVSLPPWDNSAMDGYAVRAVDVSGAGEGRVVELRVVGEIAAGERSRRSVDGGEAMRIMTGAPLPPGADCVIRVEDTDGGAPVVRILNARDAGRNVRPLGEDVRAGDIVAAAGTRIGPALLAMLAGVGCAEPEVATRPRVAIIGSGDELTTLERFDEVRAGERIVATNAIALAAIVTEAGGIPIDLGVAPDDRARIRALAHDGAACADLVVSTAGVSVGDHDHMKSIVEELGALDFWRIDARPGSQLAFGRIANTPWLGLPGNPVSALITGELFVRPAVLRMQGARRVHRAPIAVRLAEPQRRDPKTTLLLRARIEHGANGATAHLTGAQSSARMSSMAHADALIVIPAGVGDVAAGAVVAALPLHGALVMEDRLRLTVSPA